MPSIWGVVHDVVYLVGGEFMEDGNGYRTIGEGGEEGRGPAGAVAPAEGYLVAALHAAALKHDVQFLYLPRHIVILQRDSLVVGKCIKVPVLDDAFLY